MWERGIIKGMYLEDSYIKFMGHNDFQKKIRERKGLSRQQILAYRDFQNHFADRIKSVEQQLQMPIEKALTKKEVINLYRAHIDRSFTPKELAEKTRINPRTVRRELTNQVRRGNIKRIKRGVYEYA